MNDYSGKIKIVCPQCAAENFKLASSCFQCEQPLNVSSEQGDNSFEFESESPIATQSAIRPIFLKWMLGLVLFVLAFVGLGYLIQSGIGMGLLTLLVFFGAVILTIVLVRLSRSTENRALSLTATVLASILLTIAGIFSLLVGLVVAAFVICTSGI